MGTNFYWLEPAPKCHACGAPQGEPREGEHVGKRSAAGLYCWDCDETLCPEGKARIHYSTGASSWHKTCPKCGKAPAQETLQNSSCGVELGFARPRAEGERPRSVSSTASFSWAAQPQQVRQRCEENLDQDLIVSEYGDRLTGRAFLAMLRANCAVEYTDSIGTHFS